MENNTQPAELAQFPVGRVIAERYQIEEVLGHGAMGLVVKALDLSLDSEVIALKILYPRMARDKAALARFRREVILTRRLAHPNIVRIYDLGDAGDDTYFISMKYVDGQNLKQKLDEAENGKLPFDQVVKFLYQTSLGLSYAHSQDIIHRDIKPANIMVGSDSSVKITDFGVARSLVSKEELTRTDESVGSLVYMSPEQLNAESVDNRSDIYGLGIMAYHLAVGRPPFEHKSWLMLAQMHLGHPIPPFASKESGIPLWFQELVVKATAKEPKNRFQSVDELLQMLIKHASIKPDSGVWNSGRSASKRSSSRLLLLTAAAVAAALGFAVSHFF